MKMNNAIFPGTFFPFTNGHLDIIKKSSKLFDSVYIYMTQNSDKKYYDWTTIDAYADIIKKVLNREKLKNCHVITDKWGQKLTYQEAKDKDCNFIIRGLRNVNDYLYEENISQFNSHFAPDIETLYIRGSNNIISSTFVRELIKHNQNISEYVPKEIEDFFIQVGVIDNERYKRI